MHWAAGQGEDRTSQRLTRCVPDPELCSILGRARNICDVSNMGYMISSNEMWEVHSFETHPRIIFGIGGL